PPFVAARLARRPRLVAVNLVAENLVGALQPGLIGPAAEAPQLIGNLVGGNCKEIGLQFATVVEVWQAVEEADKGLLHHVLAGGPVAKAALRKGQETALVPGDELRPCLRIA